MSDIRDTLANFTKSVTKTSGDLFKTTRLSMSVSTEQNNLKALYHEIGKKVHEIYQYGGSLGKFFDDKYRELEACETKINELKEQISQIKGTRECTKCGKSAERAAEFCPKCGIRFVAGAAGPSALDTPSDAPITPEAPPAPQMQEPPQPEAPPAPLPVVSQATTRKCRVCGQENDQTTKFCLSCGRIVD